MVDISGIKKHVVLKALYNRAKAQGLGVLQDTSFSSLTDLEARALVAAGPPLSFDYIKGRIIKACIDGDEFDERLYDRDNGTGAAAEAIASIK